MSAVAGELEMTGVGRVPRASLGTIACALLLILIAATDPAPARAAIGYELDPSQPAISLGTRYPHGIAVDQENGRIYVAVASTNLDAFATGLIDQLESDGTATAASPFGADLEGIFAGVAVNPLTQGIYAAQVAVSVGGVEAGETKMNLFSSSGETGTSFNLSSPRQTVPQIATDAAGRVYYPNDTTDTVQVFNSSGTLEGEITCASCPGGAFGAPAGVAIDAVDNLYVLDLETDRVVKFAPSEGSHVYSALLQSGREAVSVGVDPALGAVFVGVLPKEADFHIVAYDSSGTQLDDFGAGLFADPEHPELALQIAADATSHRLYVTAQGKIAVFHRAPIDPPLATTNAASSKGQITATLNATVNAMGHAAVSCDFQYTEAADTSYADAQTVPCSTLPNGTGNTKVTAKPTALTPSSAYRFRIHAANNGGSSTGNDQTFETLPSLPATVGTDLPLSVTQSAATLTGTVNPHGGSVSDCHFEFGSTPAYGTNIACGQLPGPSTTEVAESATISSLTANTTYYHRLVVTSNAGTVNGNEVEFSTLPVAPAISTEAASNITKEAATLNGTIDPKGVPASCRFEYGPTTSYGSSVPCSTDLGDGASAMAQALNVSGLTAGTTYHYRLLGTNAGGTAKGQDESFTTLANPLPSPAPQLFQEQPPAPRRLRCPRGARKVRVRGKTRCVCRRGFKRVKRRKRLKCTKRRHRKTHRKTHRRKRGGRR